mmetsp:Transcript_208/g.697  ORF Transcript_208/g.697 Transcript_208/m.697 type:complete len:246 (+) Transcript_208:1259-1996(+)
MPAEEALAGGAVDAAAGAVSRGSSWASDSSASLFGAPSVGTVVDTSPEVSSDSAGSAAHPSAASSCCVSTSILSSCCVSTSILSSRLFCGGLLLLLTSPSASGQRSSSTAMPAASPKRKRLHFFKKACSIRPCFISSLSCSVATLAMSGLSKERSLSCPNSRMTAHCMSSCDRIACLRSSVSTARIWHLSACGHSRETDKTHFTYSWRSSGMPSSLSTLMTFPTKTPITGRALRCKSLAASTPAL